MSAAATGALARLCALVEREVGLVLGEHKAYLLEHRLAPLCEELSVDLAGLADRCAGDPALARRCAELLLTYESFWFRDKAPFDAIDALWGAGSLGRPWQVLSLACSTGQEPYSLALMATERWGALASANVRIVAADVSETALGRARSGRYSQTEVARGLPAPLLARHFRRAASQWELADPVRRLVEFRRVDLRQGVPATVRGWDLVLCRNVLIYMDDSVRTSVVAAIARQTAPGGHLVLGSGEPSPAAGTWELARIAGARLYRRRDDVAGGVSAAGPPGGTARP